MTCAAPWTAACIRVSSRVRWTKLRQPVAFRWPWHVQRAVWTLQELARQEEDDWCVLQQGFEPWTSSS